MSALAEKAAVPRRHRWRTVLIAPAVLVIGGGIAGVSWWTSSRNIVYTDADTIRAPADAAPLRDILWQPPVRLNEIINTGEQNYEPRIGWDALTLYFVRGKAGGDADIYVSQRTPSGWTEPVAIEEVNSPYDDLGPEPSPDGNRLYFYSDRPGGQGGYDIWVAERNAAGFRPPTNLGPLVNSPYNDYGPALTPDGHTLYFASNRPAAGDARQPDAAAWPATLREDLFRRTYDLYSAELTGRGPSQAQPIAALNTPFNDGSPCVSPSGDFLYFSSDRPGGMGGFDLYRTRWLRGAFTAAENLGPMVNTSANELDPGLTSLGYGLYFSSDRSGAAGFVTDGDPERASRHYDVYYTSSREVFREIEAREIRWAALWAAIWPTLLWLLLLLLLLLLLALLARGLSNRRLSLLTRCLLASLFLHLLAMILMSFWNVTSGIMDVIRHRGEIQVMLASAAATDDLAAQVRGNLSSIALPRPVERTAQPPPGLPPPASVEIVQVDVSLRSHVEPRRAEAPLNASDSAAPLELQPPAPPLPSSVAHLEVETPLPPTPRVAREAEPDRTALVIMASETPRQLIPASQPVQAIAEIDIRIAPMRDGMIAGADWRRAGEPPFPMDARPAVSESAPRPADLAAPQTTLDVRLPDDSVPRDDALEPMTPGTVAAAPLSNLRPGTGHFVESASSATPIVLSSLGPVTPEPRAMFAPMQLPPDAAQPKVEQPAPTVVLRGPRQDLALRLPGELTPHAASSDPEPFQTRTPAPTPLTTLRPALNSSHLVTSEKPSSVATPLPRQSEPQLAPPSPPFTPPDASVPSARSIVFDAPTAPTAVAAAPVALSLRLPSETAPLAEHFAQRSPDQRQEVLEHRGGSNETEAAVQLALQWLAEHQSADGRWDGGEFNAKCRCRGRTEYNVNVALTGLSLLCFLGAGHSHMKEGPYRDHVDRAVTWLLDAQNAAGDLRKDETMYSHGIAAIALCEALGMTGDPRLRGPVERAISFIVKARNERTGGWRYEPGQVGDTSVLGWQVMALKSAQLAGLDVPTVAFDSARQWLERVAAPDRPGIYAYRPDRRPTVSMTAEAVFTQELLGVAPEDPRVRGGLAMIRRYPPDWEGQLNTYYWYYATLALFHRQGEAWDEWNRRLTRTLLAHQRKSGHSAGSWEAQGEWANVGGRIYQTALCTLMLEVYYRYLPLYTIDSGAPPAASVNGPAEISTKSTSR